MRLVLAVPLSLALWAWNPGRLAADDSSELHLSELTGVVRQVDESAHTFHVEGDDGRRLKLVAGPHAIMRNDRREPETLDTLHENDRVHVSYDPKTLLAKEIDEL